MKESPWLLSWNPVVNFRPLGDEHMRYTTSSIPPKKNTTTNKGVIILLISGAAILMAAGIILYVRRSEPAPPPPPKPEPTRALDVPTPLVIAQPTRPVMKKPDAGGEEPAKKGKRKGGRKPREIQGTIDTNEVNRYMNAHFNQVKACYERRLKTNLLLEGKLDLNIHVGLTGAVKGVSVNSDTVRDSKMRSCVKKVIRKWKFPKPKGGEVTIAKTFNFQKSKS